MDAGNGVEVAWKTISNHLEKVGRLYERGAGGERIGQYLKGWWKGIRSGVELLGGAGLELRVIGRGLWGVLVRNWR